MKKQNTSSSSSSNNSNYRSASDLMSDPHATTPMTNSAYRGAAVYRSLALPETMPGGPTMAPFELKKANGGPAVKAHAHLTGPAASDKGEVFWDESGVKAATMKANPSPTTEFKPMPIPMIVANAPYKIVYVQSDPVALVVDEVAKLMERFGVDAQFKPEKFKWKCYAYASNGTETEFVCRLFCVPDKANYFILDFTRRCGDLFHFTSLYKSIHNELLKTGFVVNCGAKTVEPEIEIKSFSALKLPAGFPSDDYEEKADDYTPLCNMCTSQYIEVSREGLTALNGQLQSNPKVKAILAPFAEKLIQLAGASRDVQIRRLACTSLCEMSSTPAAQNVILNRSGSTVLTQLLFAESEPMETRRKAGQTLLNLSHMLPKEVGSAIKAKPILCKDRRFEQILNDLHSSF